MFTTQLGVRCTKKGRFTSLMSQQRVQRAARAAIRICEVGPRDGLQNEKWVSTRTKIELCERLRKSGVDYLEATAFVSPTKVPQMKDAQEVWKAAVKLGGKVTAIVPNKRGLDSLAQVPAEIAVLAACTDEFSLANTGHPRDRILANLRPFVQDCTDQGIRVRAYLSTAVYCPYSGWVDSNLAAEISGQLVDMGCSEVSLGDTVGRATPLHIENLVTTCSKTVSISQLALHAHDTYGQGVANVAKAVSMGITVIDSAVGGLGGCPYAPGASGNVATEDVVYLLHGMGYDTGISLPKLCETSRWISAKLGKPLSKVAQASLSELTS